MSDSESETDENFNGRSTSKRRKKKQSAISSDDEKSAVDIYFDGILERLSNDDSSSEEDSNDEEGSGSETDSESGEEEDGSDWSTESEEEGKTVDGAKENVDRGKSNANGADSDSSDGSTEKCPICLLSFRDQEVGIPENCDHSFCFICIEEWSKNVSNCPIDRKTFSTINVKPSYESAKVIRKVKVEVKQDLETEEPNEIDQTNCEICANSNREDCMLLCDHCDRGYHLFCLTPPLDEVPQGAWYCDNCFGSESSFSDNEVEDLLDSVRDMGQPTTRLRTNVRRTPRIARTRQSERIRAAIIARTQRPRRNHEVIDPNQPSTSSGFNSVIQEVARRISLANSAQRRTTRPAARKTTRRRKTRRRKKPKRRATRRRTVVEYGIGSDNNKFPMEVKTKARKKYKRRKCSSKKVGTRRRRHSESIGFPETKKKDLLSRMAVPQLTMFGNRDQLEYFSSDDESVNTDLHAGGSLRGMGETLVQTSNLSRITSRRSLLRHKNAALTLDSIQTPAELGSPIDLLSSILGTQERWLNTQRRLDSVKIASDGTLVVEKKPTAEPTPPETPARKESQPPPIDPNSIDQAPIYPRGGGNNSGFNNSQRGGYYNNNSGGYRRDSGGGGGGGSGYRSNNDSYGGGGGGGNSSFNNSMGGGNGSGGGSGNYHNFQRGGGRGRFNNLPRTPNNPNNQNNRFNQNRRFDSSNQSTPVNRNLATLKPATESNEAVATDATSNEAIPLTPTTSQQCHTVESSTNDDGQALSNSQITSTNANQSNDDDQIPSTSTNVNDDDEENDCPNFSVYSADAQDIAKESENPTEEQNISEEKDEHEEKEEDLIQMDDDDDEPRLEDDGNQTPVNDEKEPPGLSLDETVQATPAENKSSKKSILELYDDSDWEEWDIDKPHEESKVEEENQHDEQLQSVEDVDNESEEVSKILNDNDEDKDKNLTEAISEDERSYTPCLDEKQQKFDTSKSEEDEEENEITSETIVDKSDENQSAHQSTSGIGGLDTELISDEDEELFNDDPNDKNDTAKSGDPKRSNDVSESTRPGGKKRAGGNSFKKIGKNTKERNYRDKDRKRRRSRSRSRSNDKENRNRLRGNKKRDKRKDLERYDVRNVVDRHPRPLKDKYGRDLATRPARSATRSRSRDRRSKSARSRSGSRRRSPAFRRSKSRRRSFSPRRSRSRSRSKSRRRSTPNRFRKRSRTRSPSREKHNGKPSAKKGKRRRSRSSASKSKSRSRTPTLSRSRSKSFSISRSRSPPPRAAFRRRPSPVAPLRKQKRRGGGKKRLYISSRSPSPRPVIVPLKKKALPLAGRRQSRRSVSAPPRRRNQSFSKSRTPELVPPANIDTEIGSWTPPHNPAAHAPQHLTVILKNKESRKKRDKKKKAERRKEQMEKRKEKRRQRAEKQSSPAAPSKEVFASGNNILVSVSFNKNQDTDQPHQTTVVTLPASRSQIVSSRRRTDDSGKRLRKEKSKDGKKHKKIDLKPVAIIDLDRSPFKEMTPSPKAVIILSDSDNETEPTTTTTNKTNNSKEKKKSQQAESEEIQRNSIEEISESQVMSVEQASQPQSPQADESFDIMSSGPKTPPDPPTQTVKFSMSVKAKTSKLRPINPLHDAIEEEEEALAEEVANAQKDQNKVGPSTPQEPAPTSPDVYDPFEPTKSPSASPSPPPPDMGDISTNDDDVCDNTVESSQDIMKSTMEDNAATKRTQQTTPDKIINPVELVMALINNKGASTSTTTHADISSTSGDNFNIPSNDSVIDLSNTTQTTVSPGDKLSSDPTDQAATATINQQQQPAQQKSITVLSNVLIHSSVSNKNLIIPGLSMTGANQGRSPSKSSFGNATSTTKASPLKTISTTKTPTKPLQLPMPPKSLNDSSNLESPYSPGSSDYDDLFEPPPEQSSTPPQQPLLNSRKMQHKIQAATSKVELFDNLFGSASPVNKTATANLLAKYKIRPKKMVGQKKTGQKNFKSGGTLGFGKMDEDQLKMLDDLPGSAVELQVKDKFLRKLNRQERVVEEVKLVLKPHYNKKHITKEDYKNIMRRAVPKICHNRTGEINPIKIHTLIEAYVKKFRYKRKKSHSAVSSSNKQI